MRAWSEPAEPPPAARTAHDATFLLATKIAILVALDEPLHGYAIMQKVEAISEGTVVIGPGTLYGACSTLEKQGLVAMVKEEARRKYYALTGCGREVLAEQVRRLHIMSALPPPAAAPPRCWARTAPARPP